MSPQGSPLFTWGLAKLPKRKRSKKGDKQWNGKKKSERKCGDKHVEIH